MVKCNKSFFLMFIVGPLFLRVGTPVSAVGHACTGMVDGHLFLAFEYFLCEID